MLPEGKIIDLTRTLEDGQPGVTFATAKTKAADGWNARTMTFYSHTGTHLDAPLHFDCGEKMTVDQIPLESCMGMAHVIDLQEVEDRGLIRVTHLGALGEKFNAGDSILLRTGWGRHFDDHQFYRDNFPRISEELAQWCVKSGVKMLGVEPPSVADVNNLEEVTLIHEILLGADIVIVEGLVDLDQISADKVFFAALPLKIGGGDGTPCRAFVIEGGKEPTV